MEERNREKDEGAGWQLRSSEAEGIFPETVTAWFKERRRDLPWRRTYDPYQVWVSEVMLQQTQMDRVVEYFNRWLALFPDVANLAAASEQAVLKAWEGLGYYARARNLMRAARVVVEEHGGVIPDRYEQLLALPGVGPYTAAAIMSIAFDRPYPVIDANVERLFARLWDVERPMKERAVREKLEEVLGGMARRVSPRDFNQGLMELGALVCTPRSPSCSDCPLAQSCLARKAGTEAARPVRTAKKKTIEIVMACVVLKENGKIFIQQRHRDDVWGGLWEFPGGRLKDEETPEEAARRELAEETELRVGALVPLATVTHTYTRYRVTLHGFHGRLAPGCRPEPVLHAARQYRWVRPAELALHAFPSGHRQLIERML
ncbi:MAG: A/G-specific adenine glycosylase [Desulfobulbaceae bacterium]